MPSQQVMSEKTPTSLSKSLKPSWVFAMAVGSEIGWGAFILPFNWLQQSGLGGILIGFSIATLLILIIGLNYGAAIHALPATGGGVLFALSGAGRIPGYIAGWGLTLGYGGIIALNASAVTLVFRVTLPDLMTRGKLYTVAGWDIFLPEILLSITFIALFAYLNNKGFEFSGRFQFISVVILLVAVVFIVVAVIFKFFTGNITLAPAFPSDGNKIAGVFAIIAIAPWAYIGFDTVPQLAGEFNFKPRKALGLLVSGIISATLVYVSMSLATAISVGPNLAEYENSAWPPADAISNLIGSFGLILMVLAVAAGVLTGLNGFTASASRVLYTMGKTRMIPPVFSRVHQVHKTPVFAIAFISIVCCVTPFFGRAALTWIVDMTSVGIALAYFFTSFFRFRLSRADNLLGVGGKNKNSFSGQILGISGCVISVFFLALLLVPGSPGALGKESLVALLVWALLGLALFEVNKKKYYSLSNEELLQIMHAD